MPRLDAERIALLRQLCVVTHAIERRIDSDLVDEFDIPLRWFEVMAALQRAGGSMRVSDLCSELDEVASSLSRRLDRMEDEGHIVRESTPMPSDRRAVSVQLTRDGRSFWRDANVIYRRSVQRNFAQVVTESDILALQRVLSKLAR